jgi:hypothetical protein
MWAWALVMLVASYVIQSIVMKPPATPQASTLEDFDIPQVEDGTPQAVQFGDGWTSGWMVLWYGMFRTIKIKSKGKK